MATGITDTKGASIDRGNRSFWDQVAQTRWGAYISEAEKRMILKSQLLAGPPSLAIEIGAEGGRWSKCLADRGWKMVCTDLDRDALAICQKRIPDARCICVSPDARDIPAESEAARLLLSIEVGCLWECDWFIEEAFRVLKPGGIFVGVFLNRGSLRGLFKSCFSGRRPHDYSKAYWPWRSKLIAGGFQVIDEEGLCWFPFSRASNSRLVPAAVAIERHLRLGRLVRYSPWVVFMARKK